MPDLARRTIAAAAALLLAVGTAACGSDEHDGTADGADGGPSTEAPCRIATGESSSASGSGTESGSESSSDSGPESGSESGTDSGARPAVLAAEALCEIPGVAVVAPNSSAGEENTVMSVVLSARDAEPYAQVLETWREHDEMGTGATLRVGTERGGDPATGFLEFYVQGFPEPLAAQTVASLVDLAGSADGLLVDLQASDSTVVAALLVEPGGERHAELVDLLAGTAVVADALATDEVAAEGNLMLRYPDDEVVFVPASLAGALEDPAWSEVFDQIHAVGAANGTDPTYPGASCDVDRTPAGTPAVVCSWNRPPTDEERAALDTLEQLVDAAGGDYTEDG